MALWLLSSMLTALRQMFRNCFGMVSAPWEGPVATRGRRGRALEVCLGSAFGAILAHPELPRQPLDP
eukprot:8179687-Pyramimonas_sp.AAC.1